MKVEGRKVSSNKSSQVVFDFLSNMENYKDLMPESSSFSLHESGKGFSVGLKNLPEIGLKIKELEAPKTIRFTSPIPSFAYDLDIEILEQGDGSQVQLVFNGKFNTMIEMMAKKPIRKFIDTITDNAEKAFA